MTALIAVVDDFGISTPSYSEIYASLQDQFKSIYGADAYISPDSQDGQLLAIFAKAVHDSNQTAVAIYQSFSPASAVGAALSTNVKINGIARKIPTRGQVSLEIVGVAGSQITNGIVADGLGNKWALPPLVTIPGAGIVIAVANALSDGLIKAEPNSINRIVTSTRGWQTVSNPTAAIPGAPVETDAELRQRQAISTANPSQAILKGLAGAIAAIPGVQDSRIYENDTNVTNEYGHPAHSVTTVAYGGQPSDIAEAIYARKTPGAYTHGDSILIIEGAGGVPVTIRYFAASQTQVRVRVDIHPLTGFVTSTFDLIKQYISEYILTLGIGRRVDQGRLFLPAQLFGTHPLTKTFEVDQILLTTEALGAHLDSDVVIDFNALAITYPDDIDIFTV